MTARYRDALISLLAGAILPLAFAPFHLAPLALISPAILFWLWRDTDRKESALLGFLYGLGVFAVGVSWVYVAIHVFGKMAPALATASTFLFVLVLAVFYAALGYLQAYFRSTPVFLRYVVVLPALWVLLEWLRGWILTGFPWMQLGYSQLHMPIAKIAPWLGVYGVSYLVVLTVGLLVWAAMRRQKKIYLVSGFAVLFTWMFPLALSLWQWTVPVDQPIKVALLQGNVPLTKKWHPTYREKIIEQYMEMSRSARGADLVIWPEAAMPAYLQYVDEAVIRQIQNEARLYKTDFLFGVLELDQSYNGVYYNSVASIGSHNSIYRKTHLVPFGEYPPLDPLFRWVMQAMNIPMSNFSAGTKMQRPMMVAGQPVAVSVCYENLFGAEQLRLLPQATLLVNVSENAWYGDSFAPHQLVQMAQMRSLETGRPGIRVDNAGPSVVIDASGHIRARSEQFRQMVLKATLQPMAGATPYVRWGNSAIIGWLLIVLVSGLRLRRHFSA